MRTHRSSRGSLFGVIVVIGALACGGGGGGGSDNTGTGPPPPANTVQATPQLVFTPHDIQVGVGGAVTWAFGSVAHTVVFDTDSDNNPPGGNEPPPPYPGGNFVVPRGAAAAASPPGAPPDIAETRNASVSRTFATAGRFHYHCIIHPQMTGQVTVQ